MRNKLFYLCIIVAILCLCVMRYLHLRADVADDTEQVEEAAGEAAENIDGRIFFGRIGDGTGMSCIEFITQDGDTMLLKRSSDLTGNDGLAIGSTQTEVDNLYSLVTCDGGEAIDVLINLTELRREWTHFVKDWQSDNKSRDTWHREGFSLAADSTASPLTKESPRYRRWTLSRDRLLLVRELKHESAVTERCDTLRIISLTPDTLILADEFGEQVKYWRGR